jgi:hypothetical protein
VALSERGTPTRRGQPARPRNARPGACWPVAVGVSGGHKQVTGPRAYSGHRAPWAGTLGLSIHPGYEPQAHTRDIGFR